MSEDTDRLLTYARRLLSEPSRYTRDRLDHAVRLIDRHLDAAPQRASTHTVGWEDGGDAQLLRCATTDINYCVFSRGEVKPCPVCGVRLRLVWDVHFEEFR